MGACEFNSKLALNVWAYLPDRGFERVGTTPAQRPVSIPECRWWGVQPLRGTTPAALRREVAAKRIPGLVLRRNAEQFLAKLGDLRGLSVLYILTSDVTDAGLAHLKGLKNLRGLDLSGTKVTDAGLAHLKGLTNLRKLNLELTQVTDSGLAHLKGLTNLRELNLWGTKLTDAGLAHLNGLTNLRVLYLLRTKVTDAGVRELKQALPDTWISH